MSYNPRSLSISGLPMEVYHAHMMAMHRVVASIEREANGEYDRMLTRIAPVSARVHY